MSDWDKSGGAAFPCEGGDASGLVADPGMTLRDYFAGQALASTFDSGLHEEEWPENIALACYAMADAMLKAREASND